MLTIVQLVLCDFVRPEAFFEALEAFLAVFLILLRPDVTHRHDHAPAAGEINAGALSVGQSQRDDFLFELFLLRTYPCSEDVLVALFLQGPDVLVAQEAGVRHDNRLREVEALLQLLDDRQHRMPLVGVSGMDLISYRIASGADQKTQDHLWIGAFPVLGPTGDADVILPGFKIHRGGVVEHNGYGPSENLPGLIVCHFLNIALDIVCGLPPLVLGPGSQAQLIQVAVDPVLIVVLVHEVRHVAKRLQLAPGTSRVTTRLLKMSLSDVRTELNPILSKRRP